jgi:hypothetical protein
MNNQANFFENTIIESINFDGYKIAEYKTQNTKHKIQEVHKIFKKEFIHLYNCHELELNLFTEWLQGLPSVLTVPFMNYDILNNAKEAGFILDSEEQEDVFLSKYWKRLSEAFFFNLLYKL